MCCCDIPCSQPKYSFIQQASKLNINTQDTLKVSSKNVTHHQFSSPLPIGNVVDSRPGQAAGPAGWLRVPAGLVVITADPAAVAGETLLWCRAAHLPACRQQRFFGQRE